MTDKEAIKRAESLVAFCVEQNGCQNCVFRKFGADHWNCYLEGFPFMYEKDDVDGNYTAKRNNYGYI